MKRRENESEKAHKRINRQDPDGDWLGIVVAKWIGAFKNKGEK